MIAVGTRWLRARLGVRGVVFGIGVLGLAGVASGCSSKDDSGDTSGNASTGGSGGAGGNDNAIFDNSKSSGGGGPDAGTFQDLTNPDCVQEISRAETIPVDIYIMFDQSGSMHIDDGAGTRMDEVRAAVDDFVRDPKSVGIGIGIGYFGYMPLGETSCDPADYSTPDVEIAPLPDNADPIIASLNTREPTGETPTGAALRGACAYSSTHKAANPSRFAVNLLVTDGVPEAPISGDQLGLCTPTLDDAVQAAADCANGDPGIDTYVLGVGPNLQNLNQIAAAGNTEAAYLVDGGNVTERVLIALSDIRGQATIPCEFGIPPAPDGQELDYATVNVEFTGDDGGITELSNVTNDTYCGADGGWYYDETQTRILLCPVTCNAVSASTFGQVNYTLGCEQTRILR